MTKTREKPLSRLQIKNRTMILEAALKVFSQHGFRGATLDKIADAAEMSKPNMIYYFPSKDEIFLTLLNQLMDRWLAPLREIDPDGEPLAEMLTYVRRKVQMSRDMPRESRLFANEVVQGAPRMGPHLSTELKVLFDQTKALLTRWMDAGKIARCDPEHLIYSIWATTQHYADFDAQIAVLSDPKPDRIGDAETFLITLYTKLLTPQT
ncbi:MAG: TetR family transcriptional regulator C-terminal domain-containing protein [Pseudomonadota bacterium]